MTNRRAALLVALFAGVLYAPALGGGYVLDDDRAILFHPAVTGQAPVWQVFSREFWGAPLGQAWSSSYRPLTTLGFAFEHRITPAPWLHHLVNVALYGALAFLLCRVARRWLSERGAVVAGVLFACLPIHVESVAGLVGRADVLAGLFCLGAVALVGPLRPRVLCACACYLGGLLSKETVALLPLLVAWMAMVDLRRERAPRGAWLPALAPSLALAAVGLGYLTFRWRFLPPVLPAEFVLADNALHGVHGAARIWGNLAVLGRYAELVLAPVRLCADHTYADLVPPVGLFDPASPWSVVGLSCGAAALHSGWRAWCGRGRGLLFAVLIAYLLVGQWVMDLSVLIAERLMLWPSLWLCLAAAAALDRALDSARARVLVAALAGLMCMRTVTRVLDWRDEVRLLSSSAEACPRAVHGRLNLAEALTRAGRPAEAVWQYAMAAAGRSAFPGRFDVPALEAEARLALDERLRRMPELMGASDPRAFLAALHQYLLANGATAEARIVAELGRAR